MARKSSETRRMPTLDDRVLVLHGKELFLRTEFTEMIRGMLRKAHGDCEFVKFQGENADPAEVLDECRSFGLMSAHKMVVVDDADLFVRADTRPMLERYCEAPSEQATLVLRAATWRPGNLDKAINAHGAFIECNETTPDRARGWAVRRAEKTHGVRLDPAAAAMLVDRTGTDLGRLDGEMAKLAAAAGTGGVITTQLIGELVGLTREEDAWAIQSLLLGGDPRAMLRELRVIMGNGSKDVGVPVSYACCDLARKLVGAAEGLEQRQPPMKINKDLAMWGGGDAIQAAARRIGPDRARELLDAAMAVDAGIKSGLDTEIAIETLTLRFVAAL
jgi:DNA polymerase-3 subunit delta